MLKEEHSESRKGGIAHRVDGAMRVARVRKLVEALTKQSDNRFESKVNRMSHSNSLPIRFHQAKPKGEDSSQFDFLQMTVLLDFYLDRELLIINPMRRDQDRV